MLPMQSDIQDFMGVCLMRPPGWQVWNQRLQAAAQRPNIATCPANMYIRAR